VNLLVGDDSSDSEANQCPQPQRFAFISGCRQIRPGAPSTIYCQTKNPRRRKERICSQQPTGTFNLTMVYIAEEDALTGNWNPPPVTKAAAPRCCRPQYRRRCPADGFPILCRALAGRFGLTERKVS